MFAQKNPLSLEKLREDRRFNLKKPLQVTIKAIFTLTFRFRFWKGNGGRLPLLKSRLGRDLADPP
ncbi:MAG: hypothetical protein A2Y65_06885 [Deltaproteobacteria bacterium RBG_13_52_11]|nr:MAG: hypothetical protein A2Y65_06885 [Deltaproteobacteria bacterium RBG_13_52_11]